MHFRNAGTLLLHALETMWRNEVIAYLLYSINNEIKIIESFHLNLPRILVYVISTLYSCPNLTLKSLN